MEFGTRIQASSYSSLLHTSYEDDESLVEFERWVKMMLMMVLAFTLKRFREPHLLLLLIESFGIQLLTKLVMQEEYIAPLADSFPTKIFDLLLP